MKAAITALLLALCAVTVLAESSPFYVTSPTRGTTFKAGQTASLKWLNGEDQKVKVTVIEGDDPASMQPTEYSFTVDGSKSSATWKVPSSLDPKGNYAFRFDYEDEDGKTAHAYSDPFSVTGGSEESSSSSSSSSTSASSSSSSSSARPTTTASSSSVVTTASASSAAKSSSSVATSSVPSTSAASSSSGLPSSEAATSTAEANNLEGSAASLKIASMALAVPAVVAALFAA